MRLSRPALGTALLFLLIAIAVVPPGPAAAGEPRFVAGFEDLPLMPGLEQPEEGGVVFDTPAGRIVDVYAQGRVGRDAVLAFYARTLPQLGWNPEGGGVFRREGEVLRLEFSDGDGVLTVRFSLSPE